MAADYVPAGENVERKSLRKFYPRSRCLLLTGLIGMSGDPDFDRSGMPLQGDVEMLGDMHDSDPPLKRNGCVLG
jgi:hypothetical protein